MSAPGDPTLDEREQRVLTRIETARGRRPKFRDERITMAHGAGGKATQTLIEGLLVPAFESDALAVLGDAGLLAVGGASSRSPPTASSSSRSGSPAARSASWPSTAPSTTWRWRGRDRSRSRSRWCSRRASPPPTCEPRCEAIARPPPTAGVQIVAGDTKVVERGHCDSMYLTTAGIGLIDDRAALSPAALQPGDRIIVSGTIGDHGTAIMLARGEFDLDATVESDTRSLWPAADALLEAAGHGLHCLRDATRGGVASVLNELARASGVAMVVREADVPVTPAVAGAAEILGLDPDVHRQRGQARRLRGGRARRGGAARAAGGAGQRARRP